MKIRMNESSLSLLERFYDGVLTLTNHDEFIILVPTSVAIGVTAFILSNIFFSYLDLADPKWVQPYRIQDGESKKVTLEKWLGAIRLIFFNLVVVGLIMGYGSYVVYKQYGYGLDCSRNIPSLGTALLHFLFFMFVEEVGFYYLHRLFHHPRLYKYIHKVHHEWITPVSISSLYMHPLDYALVNLFPIMLGPILLHSHVVLSWMWYCFAVWATAISHCGYHLPFFLSNEAHDHHHMAFNENYGEIGILDDWHGTNKTFASSVKSQRDRIMFTTTPVKQMYPDKKKQ